MNVVESQREMFSESGKFIRSDRNEPQLVQRVRYIPVSSLAQCDARYEPGLERFVYLQSLVEE